jgi:hypothetical protein
MAPAKFDDIHKVANEVISDDFQTSGYQFQAKQKTSLDGAIITSAVDLFPGKDGCMTPAKLTWKIPTPAGYSAFAIDKLEMDKTGGLKLEMSSEKAYKGLKLECKSDLKSISNIVAACTYTGLKDTLLKLETNPKQPEDVNCEITRAQGPATFGAKFGAAKLLKSGPELGVSVISGPFFASLYAKEAFGAFHASCHYKQASGVRCAAAYCVHLKDSKKNGNFAVAVAYEPKKGTTLKAKLQQDLSVSCSVKHVLSQGFTLLGGLKYDTAKGTPSYGFKLSVE